MKAQVINTDLSRLCHIICVRGDSFGPLKLTFKNRETGVVSNISSDTFTFVVTDQVSGSVLLNWGNGTGTQVVGNKVIIGGASFPINLAQGIYNFRLRQLSGSGLNKTRAQGTFEVI